MSVERIGYFQRYCGLSADEKPTFDEDAPISLLPGAEFVETDTNLKYQWDGDQWILYSVPSGTPLNMEVYEPTTTLIFTGEAPVGSKTTDATWRIKRIDTSTGTEILWAEGTANFDKIWTNSTEYIYS